jgi:hypothetical protein
MGSTSLLNFYDNVKKLIRLMDKCTTLLNFGNVLNQVEILKAGKFDSWMIFVVGLIKIFWVFPHTESRE